MFDRIEKMGHSTIQHGPNNNRIYLMKLADVDMPNILSQIEQLAEEEGYTKIFAKVGEKHFPAFMDAGYAEEARIPRFKKGEHTICFLSKYLDNTRGMIAEDRLAVLRENLSLANSKKGTTARVSGLPEGYSIRALIESDAPSLAELYKSVFDVYPFPIFDPEYLGKTMREHIRYFGVFHGNELVAAASSEMDREDLNVEMTDFATRKDHLGKNLSYFLLKEMEIQMRAYGMKTLYTIARSESIGMNTTFARLGYEYAGMLLNNTMIGKDIECMNVWYKSV